MSMAISGAKQSATKIAVRFTRLIRTNQFWCGFGCMTLLLVNGCLSRPPLVKQSFAFALPSVVSNTPAASNRVLAIRSLTVEPPFDGPSLIYRTGEFSYERDSYANFLVSPAQSLVVPVREYFRG